VLVLPRSLRALLHAAWGHDDLLSRFVRSPSECPPAALRKRRRRLNARSKRVSDARQPTANEGDEMYIGGGVLALILIIILLIWLF
jgi:hypothetical protein